MVHSQFFDGLDISTSEHLRLGTKVTNNEGTKVTHEEGQVDQSNETGHILIDDIVLVEAGLKQIIFKTLK